MSGRATSFYYSFLALPADKRNAIVAVWDFCRAVDDAVDEPGDRDPVSALAQWRDEVARLYEGRGRGHAAGNAPGAVHRRIHAAAVGVRGFDRRRGHGSAAQPVRHVRGAAAVLSARRVGGRPDLRRDFRVSRFADPRLRHRSRHRAAIDEYHPRRGAGSRARAPVHSIRGSAAFRLHRG